MEQSPLPPGWVGNAADHHIDAGTYTIKVCRASAYNPFRRKHERTGGYQWAIRMGSALVANGPSMGEPTPDAARLAAKQALRIHLLGAIEMLDWMDHPSGGGGS